MGTFLARHVMTRLVDDIDGSHAVTTVSFSLDGSNYEIDLSESHVSALQEVMAPFISAARAVPDGRRAVRAPAPERAPAPTERVREVIAQEVAQEVAAPRPTGVGSAPFQQPALTREGVAAPVRSKPAPLVADPFNPRS